MLIGFKFLSKVGGGKGCEKKESDLKRRLEMWFAFR
jgi:hypothetical protein